MSTDATDVTLAQQIAAQVIEAFEQRFGDLDRDTRPLLSVPQAAERLNISAKGMWNIVQRGEVPSVLVGENRRMIEPAALETYIASRRDWTGAPEPG